MKNKRQPLSISKKEIGNQKINKNRNLMNVENSMENSKSGFRRGRLFGIIVVAKPNNLTEVIIR